MTRLLGPVLSFGLLATALDVVAARILNPAWRFGPGRWADGLPVAASLLFWCAVLSLAVAAFRQRDRRRQRSSAMVPRLQRLLAGAWPAALALGVLHAERTQLAILEHMPGRLAFVTGTGTALAVTVAALAWRWAWRRHPVASDRPGRWLALGLGACLAALPWQVPADRQVQAPPRPATTRPVVLLGIDGADWATIDRWATQLPTLSGLRHAGATGPLATEAFVSPVLWSTIATGQPAAVHGIRGFYTLGLPGSSTSLFPVPGPLASQFLDAGLARRKVGYRQLHATPIWDIVARNLGPVVLFNWFFTAPVPPLAGLIAADEPTLYFDPCAAQAHLHTHGPEEFLSPATTATAVWAEVCAASAAAATAATCAAAGTDAPPDCLSVALDPMLQLEINQQRLFLQALARVQPVFAAYYTGVVDGSSHRFAQTARAAGRPGDGEPGMEVRVAYRLVDRFVGAVLAAVGPETLVIVVSDHGWDYEALSHGSFPPGIIALRGAGVEPAPIEAATIYDVAPTVLNALGLPLTTSMPGRPLGPTPAGGVAPRIAAYAPPLRAAERLDLGDHETYVERYFDALRALGYVQ